MVWHDIRNPNDPELDRLAEKYKLHPLHIEDCRHRNQNAKIEEQDHNYLFIVLKPVEMQENCSLSVSDLDFFIGTDFLITVQEQNCVSISAVLDYAQRQAQRQIQHLRPDQLFYRLSDALVDSYLPILDQTSGRIDKLEDAVLEDPDPALLQQIFDMKRSLMELRRILTNTRDVAGRLQRMDSPFIGKDMWPFLRDIYDHLARSLDNIEIQRDLLTGGLEIYLSSVANRTNQTMKVLTVLGTLALPAIVISGIYGMNLQHLPWADNPHAAAIVTCLILLSCLLLVLLMKRSRLL